MPLSPPSSSRLRLRLPGRSVWCLFALLLLFPKSAEAWQWGRWKLQLKLDYAIGYDDNVRRIAIPPQPDVTYPWIGIATKTPITSPLPPVSIHSDGHHQVGLQLKLLFRHPRHVLQVSHVTGLKHFFLTPDEDALSQNSQLSYYFRAHRRILLGAHLSGGDLRRWNQSREFSHLRGRFQFLWLAPLGFQLDVTGGYGLFLYRHFEAFKDLNPEGISDGERFSSHGDAYAVTLRKSFSRVFRARISYQLSRQFYQVLRVRSSNVCTTSQRAPRADLQHNASVGLRILYVVLFDVSYQLAANNAESCGESYLGHRLFLRFAARPFWRLYFTAELNLQFRSFVDGAPFDPSISSSQDDNLTSFTLRLSRPILPHLDVNLRYSHFANLLGLGINQYARNLFTIGITLRF